MARPENIRCYHCGDVVEFDMVVAYPDPQGAEGVVHVLHGNCATREYPDTDDWIALPPARENLPAASHAGYTAGWNMPGYLPESEPEHFDTYAEARAYLVETVERFWDDDTDVPDVVEDERWLDVHTALHNAAWTTDDGTHTFTATCGDGYLTFWITPSED